MIVAEAISRKMDPEGLRLQFKVSNTEDPTAERWRSLIDMDDKIYPIKELHGGIVEEATKSEEIEMPVIGPPAEEMSLEEQNDENLDLQSYPAPESDAEDSDDDPTLVSREKIVTPL